MKQDAKQFFNSVREYLALYDWDIRFRENSGEGYCWKNKKIIDIGIDSKNIKHLILHELAHVFTCRFCNNKHDVSFWKQYELLRYKFLRKTKLSKHEIYHEKISDYGIYKLVYL